MTERSNKAEAPAVARTLGPFLSARLCALAFGDEELSALCSAGLAERRGGWHRVTPFGVAVAQALGPEGEAPQRNLDVLIERLAADMLDPYCPIELVEQELRDAGLDPDEVGKEAEELLRKFLAEKVPKV